MIYGVGTDLIEIRRVERVLVRFGERFARRILCEPELKRFRAHKQPWPPRQALRREGGVHQGARHRHPRAGELAGVWVVNLKSGKPQLEFSDELQKLLTQRRIRRSHLSLTDEREIAAATVILECAD
jgi:holo-[acyl-carrier protein] synthase